MNWSAAGTASMFILNFDSIVDASNATHQVNDFETLKQGMVSLLALHSKQHCIAAF
jgi:hypothetical protein